MSDFKRILKSQWHPEKLTTSLKSQMSLVGGKTSNDHRQEDYVPPPLSSLRDPSSFGPPPRYNSRTNASSTTATSSLSSAAPPALSGSGIVPSVQMPSYHSRSTSYQEPVEAEPHSNESDLGTKDLPSSRAVPPPLQPRLPARSTSNSNSSGGSYPGRDPVFPPEASVPGIRTNKPTDATAMDSPAETSETFQTNARSAASTLNGLRQRHGKHIDSGMRLASDLNRKYGVSERLGKFASGLVAESPSAQDDKAAVMEDQKSPPAPPKRSVRPGSPSGRKTVQ